MVLSEKLLVFTVKIFYAVPLQKLSSNQYSAAMVTVVAYFLNHYLHSLGCHTVAVYIHCGDTGIAYGRINMVVIADYGNIVGDMIPHHFKLIYKLISYTITVAHKSGRHFVREAYGLIA